MGQRRGPRHCIGLEGRERTRRHVHIPGWASELAPITLAIVGALVPFSAGADLQQRGIRLSLHGVKQINIPSLAVPFADFVAQGASIPVADGNVNIAASLSPCKMAMIVKLTREMVEGGNAEALTKQALLDVLGPSLDRRMFDANPAVPELRPPGLLFGNTPLAPGSDMISDLGTLAAKVAPYAGNGGISFVASAKQATAITLGVPGGFPYPLMASTQLADGKIIAVANAAIVSALGATPLIDLTKSATLTSSDGSMTATFQTDTVAVRVRWPIAWALREPNAIASMTVTW